MKKFLDLNKVYLIDVCDFLKQIKNNSVDLIIADPPYFFINEEWDKFENQKEYIDFMKEWISLAIKKLKKNGSIYIFNTPKNIFWLGSYLISKKMIFKNNIVWHKKDGFANAKKKFVNNVENILFFSKGNDNIFNFNDIRVSYESESRINLAFKKGILKNGKRWFPNKNGKLCTNVWNITSNHNALKINGKNKKNIHPTQKPMQLIERIVKASSCENDLVLDLFSGSGTTSVVCKKNNRNFIGCERNKEFFKIIIERLK